MIYIRNVVESDHKSIVKLNDTEVQQTSEMSFDHLRSLIELSSYCKVATVERQVAAFLIALRDSAPYENDNYRWFSSRFQNFLYVDRIVVGSDFSGRKIGSKLYTDMFEFARLQGIKTIACEYNIEPPNLPSRAFHDKFGFRELGTQWVASGTKLVSLQTAET
ncbi:MAG TPA: GNAT family N-acetyltransferase [Marinobacter sp.]|nr:GNAT family N-acetyltransferase [Marinobacter sp.]